MSLGKDDTEKFKKRLVYIQLIEKKFKRKIGKKVFNILLDLANKQQLLEDNEIENIRCLACGTTNNICEHHISYNPEIKVYLCSKHHSYLHAVFLEHKKVKP